ncbi:MAG TPA: AraC family transcriptional regulator, partial [Tepidisphaeraceae bacterium]|nr:AraC family transcriptional regulator [Tepidisphaeraceae bacterium]
MDIARLPSFVAAGECVTDQGWVHPRETLPHHKLIVCANGAFDLLVGQSKVALRPGDYVLIDANEPWEGLSRHAAGERFWWIMFRHPPGGADGSFSVPARGTLPQPALAKAGHDRLVASLGQPHATALARSLDVMHVLAELQRQTSGAGGVRTVGRSNTRAHDLAHRVIVRLKRDVARTPDLKLLARELQMNPTYLRRAFKQATGHTPLGYHRLLQVDAAKQLLAETTLGVGQIGHRVGIANAAHFSRLFQRHAGVWPTAYRSRQTVA